MHIRSVTKTRPQSAIYIEQVLDIILSVIQVINGIMGLLGKGE